MQCGAEVGFAYMGGSPMSKHETPMTAASITTAIERRAGCNVSVSLWPHTELCSLLAADQTTAEQNAEVYRTAVT